MKILVTGGAGFIASHIVDAYIAQEHQVAVIDNLASGFRKNLNRKARFYKVDIKNRVQLEKVFKDFRPEVVNHHAAIAEVVKSLRDPIPTYETNVLGTANLALLFGQYAKGRNKKFIFASTGGAIYGDPKKIPATENTLEKPLSPYGLSKLLGEEVIKFYARTLNFPYFIFRYSNVFGPRQNPKGEAGVVAIFGLLMKSKKQPIIFGDGSKVRDYVYVGDVVRANVLALKKGVNETINIGQGKAVTDKMIFDAIAKVARYNKPPRYAPFRKGEVEKITLNYAKAGKVLGWKPQVDLEEGVRLAVEGI
ncbi:MAG: NAD-dependent epimerase/dehydratase family protein [Anaplasmataceae bacterium]|nr:NAD-dependent epimerase/dehydratase family protein [Anaplasmataceae bacterium]